MDLSWQPVHRSCPAAKAATARAAVDRCGPGHVATPLSPTGTEEGQGRSGGYRGAPGESSSPAGALQPGRAAGPQERVPQRTVESMLEMFVPVPSLDVLVAQMVGELVERRSGRSYSPGGGH